MHRTRAERRHNDWMKIRRKAKIVKEHDKEWYDNFWVGQEHRLSKNKIHCSCFDCSEKMRRNGPTLTDHKKFDKLQSSLDESTFYLKVLPRRGW